MLQCTEKLKLLKVEERQFEQTKYLRVRFLNVDEFIDLSYYLNKNNSDRYTQLANAELGKEFIVDIGVLVDNQNRLKLLDLAVVE